MENVGNPEFPENKSKQILTKRDYSEVHRKVRTVLELCNNSNILLVWMVLI